MSYCKNNSDCQTRETEGKVCQKCQNAERKTIYRSQNDIDINDFIDLIETSMRRVKNKYFGVVQAESETENHWEDTYKYEFYHQMRCVLFAANKKNKKNHLNEYLLDVEQRKDVHQLIKMRLIPDMIFHRRGKMGNNFCVMEIKRNYYRGEVIKDFRTLRCMLTCFKYSYGIFIIVGEKSVESFSKNLVDDLQKIPRLKGLGDRVYVLMQKREGASITRQTLAQLWGN